MRFRRRMTGAFDLAIACRMPGIKRLGRIEV